MKRVCVSGSLAYDRIMDFPGYFKDHILPDKIHQLNVSFTVQDFKEHFGGTAGNIAYNLAFLGANASVFSSAGFDFAPYKEHLLAHGVDVSGIHTEEKIPTAAAHIITDKTDNQITGFFMGAMAQASDFHISSADFAILAPGNIDDMKNMKQQCDALKIPVMFDPGQVIPVLSAEDMQMLLEKSKIFISNDYELALVLKKLGIQEYDLLSMVEIVVTTLGEKGSVITTKDEKISVPPAKPQSVLDPTGAGDAYRAGLVAGFFENKSLEEAGKMGAVAAVYTVEKYGTQTHVFTREEFQKRYQENFE